MADKQYYNGFFDRTERYDPAVDYAIGDVVSYVNAETSRVVSWVATEINGPATTVSEPTLDSTAWQLYESELGDGRFITLEDLVVNYMVGFADEMSHGGMSNRYKVEFFAQRAIQEFSYDVFSVKSQEFSLLNTDIPMWPMPSDFVSLAKASWVDESGREMVMSPRRISGNPRSPLQNNISGEFLYDELGNIIYADESVESTRWRNTRNTTSYNSFTGSGSFEGGFDDYGKRYYLDPEHANQNGTYFINEEQGTISFDTNTIPRIATTAPDGSVVNGDMIVSIYYVSDGLSSDLSEVKVHKFAEQAIYESIYAELMDKRRDVPANEKQKAMKRARALRRNAKHKLSQSSHRELIQAFRAQSRWIKT